MADDLGRPTLDDETETLGRSPSEGYERDLAAFVAYWNSMRRGADVPLRTEIDPRGIEALLSNAFIAEKIAPGLARLRIAGAHLADIMGMEVRGMPLSALIDPADRDRLADALVDLFERPAQLRLDLTAQTGRGRGAKLTATMLVLPLRSDLGDVSRALGCLVTSGQITSAPQRFRIARCQVSPIETGTPARIARPGFAEEQTRLTAPARHASERPWLRLVHSE